MLYDISTDISAKV